MAKTHSRTASATGSREDSGLGRNLKQEKLSTDGSSWRAKFMANAYGHNFESSRRRRTAKETQGTTSAEAPSAGSEKQD